MIDVVVYEDTHKHRSKTICNAMVEGIMRVGDRVRLVTEGKYIEPIGDVAVFYGLSGNLTKIFNEYPAAGKKAVYVDLGYWARVQGGTIGRFKGYHKVTVNSRHPTAYFQNHKHDNVRAARLGLEILPWKDRTNPKGDHILVAGMGSKAAYAEGFLPERWERQAIDAMTEVTRRRIIYRPKPSCPHGRPLTGADFSPRDQPLVKVLNQCHAIVTHHSNVAVDGLLAGIPTFCMEGAAVPMSLQDLTKIEDPYFPEDRQQWLNDLAYCQWHVAEISEGLPWRHLKNEGVI